MKYLRMFETTDERDDVLRDNPYDSILSFTKEAEYGSCISKPIPENEIWYVSQTNDVVEPYATNVFGANIVSNTYINGKGIIKFDGNVTTIGTRAFYTKSMLTSIIIPQSVTTIGDYAFYATYISKFIFTHNLTSIGGYAFSNCNYFRSLTIPDGINLSLNSTTFLYDMMGSVKIGNGVTIIDGFRNGSFYNININGNEETVIRDGAFNGSIVGGDFYVKTAKSIGNIFNRGGASASLNNLVLEDIDEIGSNAFYSVTANNILLKNVKSIGQTAFGDLSYTGKTRPHIEIIGDTNIGYQAFSQNQCIGSIVLKPYSNMIIGEEAFSHVYNNNGIDIKEFNIPSGVTQIGKKAFYDNLIRIFTIPDTVQSIGEQAFFTCYGIDYISCDPNNSVYDSRENCNALIETSTNKLIAGSNQTTHIPSTVTSIDTNAFAGCEDLLSIDVPNTITSIGNSAFGGVKNINYRGELEGAPWGALHMNAYLEDGLLYEDDTKTTLLGASISLSGEIVIPSSVTAIAGSAFIRCKNITSITIPNSITAINSNTFQGCTGLTSITIPNSVTTIGAGAFKGCTGLTNITIPNSVTTIDGNGNYYNTSGAFEGCTGLTNINIPNSVTSIGGAVFKGCTGLTSITIPNSVTSIGASTFQGCTGLTSITIPNSVTSINGNAFQGCTGLTSITIPNSVTSINGNAFQGCTGLTSINIPNSVTSIKDGAFQGCTGLTNVTGMNSVTTLGSDVFENCTELTEVNVSSVTSMGSDAFYKCKKITSLSFDSIIEFKCSSIYDTSLETLVLGSSVTKIDDSGGGLHKLTSFTCKAVTPPTLYRYSLDYSNNCPIYVPAGSVDRYKSASNWSKYASRIQAIPA